MSRNDEAIWLLQRIVNELKAINRLRSAEVKGLERNAAAIRQLSKANFALSRAMFKVVNAQQPDLLSGAGALDMETQRGRIAITEGDSAARAMEMIKARAREVFESDDVATWFEVLRPISRSGQSITLEAPHERFAAHYMAQFGEWLEEVLPEGTTIEWSTTTGRDGGG